MDPTPDQLTAVLTAALHVLGARQDHMLGLDEWVDLARAVSACTHGKTTNLLTDRDLDDAAEREIDWDEAADGTLPSLDDE
jgi:hypothetical protein